MTYRVVFDITEAGYKSWSFPAFGLIFIFIGVLLLAFRRNLPGFWSKRPQASAVFAYLYLGFAVFWTLTTFLSTYRDYYSLVDAEKSGHVQVVQGPVSDFKPMPFEGHSMERFCVRSDCFEYSDYVVTSGFNNTSAHGGPIKDGLLVKVAFVGNAIVKLEVAK